MSGPLPGPDGRLRCPWALGTPDYLAYHDDEWGRPVHGDGALYERLTLEAFQSGLSWLTILRKRDGFRRAFADFDPDVVARYGEADTARLMPTPECWARFMNDDTKFPDWLAMPMRPAGG